MSSTLKIFLACALGGGIGTLVALQTHPFFWWLGLLAGGAIGYISYDFNRVTAAIKLGFSKFFKFDYGKVYDGCATFIRSNFWKIVLNCTCFLNIMIGVIAAGSVIFGGAYYLGVLPTGQEASDIHKFFVILGIVASLLSGVFSQVKGDLWVRKEFGINIGSSTTTTGELKKFLKMVNPLTVVVFWFPLIAIIAAWYTVKGTFLSMYFIVDHIPSTVRKTVRMCRFIFRAIHSELRLLCMFDAAIGAGVGYFLGSVLVGALAGGILGVVNYELVSKKYLGLNSPS